MTTRIPLAASLSAAVACGGSEGTSATMNGSTETTENGSANSTGEPDYCGSETTTVLTDLDAIPAGFDRSARDVLTEASGSYTGTMTWGAEDPIVVFAHADTSADVAFSLTHTGEVRLVEVENVGGDPTASAGSSFSCSNRIEIDMTLDFSTSDGLFDEVLDVELYVDSHQFDPILALPAFSRTLDLDDLNGDLSSADFELAGSATMREVLLRGRFSADGTAAGSLETIANLASGSRQVAPGNWSASR